MKKLFTTGILALCSTTLLCACASAAQAGGTAETGDTGAAAMEYVCTADTKNSDVVNDPVFGDYGRLIFPVDTGYCSGDTLGDLRLTWYSHIDPNKTVEIVNDMYAHAKADDRIFYDIQDLFYDHDGRTIAAGMGGHCQHGPGEDRCAGTFFQRCGSDDCLGRRRMFL